MANRTLILALSAAVFLLLLAAVATAAPNDDVVDVADVDVDVVDDVDVLISSSSSRHLLSRHSRRAGRTVTRKGPRKMRHIPGAGKKHNVAEVEKASEDSAGGEVVAVAATIVHENKEEDQQQQQQKQESDRDNTEKKKKREKYWKASSSSNNAVVIDKKKQKRNDDDAAAAGGGSKSDEKQQQQQAQQLQKLQDNKMAAGKQKRLVKAGGLMELASGVLTAMGLSPTDRFVASKTPAIKNAFEIQIAKADSELIQRWRKTFEMMDANHDGAVTMDELITLFKERDKDKPKEQQHSEAELLKAFKTYDLDKSGAIMFDEFFLERFRHEPQRRHLENIQRVVSAIALQRIKGYKPLTKEIPENPAASRAAASSAFIVGVVVQNLSPQSQQMLLASLVQIGTVFGAIPWWSLCLAVLSVAVAILSIRCHIIISNGNGNERNGAISFWLERMLILAGSATLRSFFLIRTHDLEIVDLVCSLVIGACALHSLVMMLRRRGHQSILPVSLASSILPNSEQFFNVAAVFALGLMMSLQFVGVVLMAAAVAAWVYVAALHKASTKDDACGISDNIAVGLWMDCTFAILASVSAIVVTGTVVMCAVGV